MYYLGPAGTFTNQAALTLSRNSEVPVPLNNIDDVYAAVIEDSAASAAVAIENSVEGYVVPSLNLLMKSYLVAVAKADVSIEFAAMRVRGDTAKISVVKSHPHALAQCEKFIASLGEIKVVPTDSTASACRDLIGGELALGPQICSQLYDRVILNHSVQDETAARTSFLRVINRDNAFTETRHLASDSKVRSMIALTPKATGEGVLASMLNIFADWKLNISSLITRPVRTQPEAYCFVVTVDGHPSNFDLSTALDQLLALEVAVKTLGIFIDTNSPRVANELSKDFLYPEGAWALGVDLTKKSLAILK